ncbi:hypothetical protein LTR28_004192 [Elasticomyces elasticus]|nr:hypothetical protein LTR28_004192 [Elasticomyces elasticus]
MIPARYQPQGTQPQATNVWTIIFSNFYITISLALTSNIYRRSDDGRNYPRLIVTTTLESPEVATVELRGEKDSGTILETSFCLEHLEFYDLTDSRVVVKTPFRGTCEPRVYLEPHHVVELKQDQALKTSQHFEDMDPLADPVRMLKVGHEYRITLKPQNVWWVAKSKAELFDRRDLIPVKELPEGPLMRLASKDELRLKVEE